MPIVASILLTGCIKEEYDDCERCTLTFSYTADGSYDVFQNHITDVSLYVFDAEDRLVQTKQINKSDLQAFQGTKLNLRGGTYRIVGVGNNFDKTEINNTSAADMSQIHFNHPNALKSGKVEGNDSLYLGSKIINVPHNDWIEEVVPFQSSHFKVSYTVETEGADWDADMDEEKTRALVDGYYDLQVSNLLPKTDLNNRAHGEGVTYNPALLLDTENGEHKAYFNIMRHPFQSDVTFNLIYKQTGEVLHSLRLEDFLTMFPQIDITKQEVIDFASK